MTNAQLTLNDLPAANATWSEIAKFALRFNGYEVQGSLERCAEIANSRKHDSVADLRTCLFFEQRRWRHFGEAPDAETMQYIRDVIEKLRAKLSGEGCAGGA
jgi:hypothetical protein